MASLWRSQCMHTALLAWYVEVPIYILMAEHTFNGGLTYLRIHLLGLIRISLTLLFMARMLWRMSTRMPWNKMDVHPYSGARPRVCTVLHWFQKKMSLSFAGPVFFVFKSCIIICFFEWTYLSLISVTANSLILVAPRKYRKLRLFIHRPLSLLCLQN